MRVKETIQNLSNIMKFNPSFLMMVGVPGSGKSTFLKELNYPDLLVASTDKFIDQKAAELGITYTQAFGVINFKTLKTQMNQEILEAVRKLRHIALDQTNMSKKSRRSKLAMIPETYVKVCLNFSVDDKVLMQRLHTRAVETGKVISDQVLNNMFGNYQTPTLDEGFNFVFEVDNTW